MRPFLALLFLLYSTQSISQFKPGDSIVHLNYFSTKDLLPNGATYRHVTVIDNRLDSTPFISTIIAGGGLPLKLRFDTTPAVAIERFISTITGNSGQGDKELVISLHRYIMLRYVIDGPKYLFFTADAYERMPDSSYVKVYTIDTIFKKQAEDFLDGKAFALLLSRTGKNAAGPIDNIRWSIQEIKENKVYKSWSSYPIIHDNDTATGIYLTMDQLKNNELIRVNLELKQSPDSTYELSIPDGPDSLKDKIQVWWRRPTPLFKYRGNIYIRYYAPIVRLYIKNNTFYMHMPEGYPNVFSYQLVAYSPRGRSTNFMAGLTDQKLLNDVLRNGIKRKDFRDNYLDLGKNISVTY
jgi:hypothetical protein